MNQTLYTIMLIYCIASIVYILFLIYQKIKKVPSFEEMLKDNDTLITKYKELKKTRTIVFIIGLLIGFAYILLFENESKPPIVQPNMSLKNVSIKDIQVIN